MTPVQYISMRAPETTVVVPNGSHYRDSHAIIIARLTHNDYKYKAKAWNDRKITETSGNTNCLTKYDIGI